MSFRVPEVEQTVFVALEDSSFKKTTVLNVRKKYLSIKECGEFYIDGRQTTDRFGKFFSWYFEDELKEKCDIKLEDTILIYVKNRGAVEFTVVKIEDEIFHVLDLNNDDNLGIIKIGLRSEKIITENKKFQPIWADVDLQPGSIEINSVNFSHFKDEAKKADLIFHIHNKTLNGISKLNLEDLKDFYDKF